MPSALVEPPQQAIGEPVSVTWWVAILEPKHKASDYSASINWAEGAVDHKPSVTLSGCYLTIKGTKSYFFTGNKKGTIFVTCKKKAGWKTQTSFTVDIGLVGPKTTNSEPWKFVEGVIKSVVKAPDNVEKAGKEAADKAVQPLRPPVAGRGGNRGR
jgi:hypothetical protein